MLRKICNNRSFVSIPKAIFQIAIGVLLLVIFRYVDTQFVDFKSLNPDTFCDQFVQLDLDSHIGGVAEGILVIEGLLGKDSSTVSQSYGYLLESPYLDSARIMVISTPKSLESKMEKLLWNEDSEEPQKPLHLYGTIRPMYTEETAYLKKLLREAYKISSKDLDKIIYPFSVEIAGQYPFLVYGFAVFGILFLGIGILRFVFRIIGRMLKLC